MMGGGLILCAIIFHHAILTLFVTWSMQAYSIAKWGKPLHYEDIILKGHQLVIIQPRFEHESLFSADRMALDFHINLWKRQLHIGIEIEQPHWHFQTTIAAQWEKWANFLSQEDKWIKTHPLLRVRAGTLSWILEDSSHQLKFDLEINNQEGGYVKLYFDSPELQSRYLVLQTLKFAQGVEVSCRCEKLDCPSLSALAHFLGVDISPWLITSGSLHGELKAIFPDMRRPYLEGELHVQNLAFNQLGSVLKGQIEEAKLQLKKNEIAYEFNHPFLTTIGRLDILKPASLSYCSPLQAWDIRQIIGSIQLDDVETALINLQAQGGNFHHPSQWVLQGKTNLNAQHSLGLDLVLSCFTLEQSDGVLFTSSSTDSASCKTPSVAPRSSAKLKAIPSSRVAASGVSQLAEFVDEEVNKTPAGKIHLALSQGEEGVKHITVQCESLSYAECGFLQTLLATHWPVFNEILLENGELNALIEADLFHQGIGELHIKQFEAFHVCSKVKSWNMACHFGQIRGHGKVNLGQADFWQSIQAGLHLEDGTIQFEDLSPPLPMTDIQAHLLLQQGHVEHSLITLQVAGLKGKMDVEWGEYKQLLTFKLDGVAQDLSDLFPSTLQEGIRNHFYHNRLMVLANLKRQNQHIELGGTLHIQRANTDEQMDLIHFGCELKKVESGPDSKYIPVGWFHAQKLPLEKFLSPFIFHKDILSLSGEAEFKGSFDEQFLFIKYDADNLKIENEDLCIEIPHLHAPTPGQLVGSHQLDLRTYLYQGTLPIQSASYFEKNTGLLFQDIQGLISLSNGFIRILPIEAYCQGIYFAGEVELDYRDPAPGVFDLIIHCPSLSGKVSQIQHLLAHLDQPSLLNKIPLEGEVTAKEEGLRLKFAFVPQNYHLQARVKGIINEGALSFESADMALRGIYMDVDYDHQRQLLEFSDIQGSLLVGKPRRVEEYLLTGHHIHFYQIEQPNIDVDIAVKDKEHELMRIVGYTSDTQEGIKGIYLNPKLSHISCIYPKIWKCQLRDWSNIEQLEFDSNFNLENLLQDLKRFRQTGLPFLSHSTIDKISQILPLEGEGSFALRYQPDQSFTYHLEGTQIKLCDSSEHYGLIKGSKQGKKWIIDQAQWDDWNAYAELHQMDEKWRIPFLGLKVGQTLLLGLDGDWLQEEACLKAKLKFCQVDLSKLDYFSSLQSFVAKWWPKGTLNATGEIEWNLLASNPLEGCQATLLAEVSNFTLRNCPFAISNGFQMKVKPHHYICLEDVQVELSKQAYIDLKQFNYQLPQEALYSLEAAFQIPHHQLEVIGETLHHHFPDILETSVKEIFITSKQQDQLKGMVTIKKSTPNQSMLRLRLEDGRYLFKNREFDLKKFQLQVNGNEIHFSAFSQEERLPFQVTGKAKWPSCQEGQCQLISLDGSKPLIINWENQPEGKWTICSMQGEFAGCSFFLKKGRESVQNSEWMALQGQVIIDFNRSSALLTPKIANTIQNLKVGSLYTFSGNFWMNPDKEGSFLDTISFKGTLASKEAILKGYQMENLQADVQYIPGRLDIQNFLIKDSAGTVKVANCAVLLDQRQNQWNFFIPRLSVRNLRLNLLRDTESCGQTNAKFRSLILKRIEFQDLGGKLDEVQTWQAQGSFHFLNASRKNALHSLFAIPAEIILRLGLDPHVFNPVTGIIYFNLQGDRFYLNRFKDVYSEGRGSKFYLVGPAPSWMDFDGNLSVNIRMKQYNLLFKIAELFTVSIRGNIKKPRYTLQKQVRNSKKEYEVSMITDEKLMRASHP